MVRGLHASCNKVDIQEDLHKRGFKILDAVNILKKEKRENDQGIQIVTKRGLPLFMLTFEHHESVEKIYEIKT